MVRLARWRLVLATAMAFAIISSPTVRAQDAPIVTALSPETAPAADTAAPVVTEAATIPLTTEAAAVATEAVTLPAVTESAAPLVTEAVTTPVEIPSQTLPPIEAVTTTPIAVTAPVSTDAPTTETPPVAPSSTSQVPADTNTTIPQDATASGSSLRGSAPSLSSSSRDVSAIATGTLEGSSITKTIVITVLGGVGLTIVLSLLFVVWRSRTRDDSDLEDASLPPDTGTIAFPGIFMSSNSGAVGVGPAWKATGTSFATRDLPLTEDSREKLNATTRTSIEYDLGNRPSQIAGLTLKPQETRGTNASSEPSFSIRGYSEFSVIHGDDSESSAVTNNRFSTNDGYSTGDRYSSTNDRYSTSSRLSSEPGRSNSGWFRQAPKSLDMHRFSSTSSTASSVVARKHNPVSLINHDLTQTPCIEAPVGTVSSRSRSDVPDWYSVIESPTDNDRYTASSLDSDNISSERESFEL